MVVSVSNFYQIVSKQGIICKQNVSVFMKVGTKEQQTVWVSK